MVQNSEILITVAKGSIIDVSIQFTGNIHFFIQEILATDSNVFRNCTLHDANPGYGWSR